MGTLTVYIGNKTGIAYVTDHNEDGKPCCATDPFLSPSNYFASEGNDSFFPVKDLEDTDDVMLHGSGNYPEFCNRRTLLVYKLSKIGIDFKALEENAVATNNGNFWQLHATTIASSDANKISYPNKLEYLLSTKRRTMLGFHKWLVKLRGAGVVNYSDKEIQEYSVQWGKTRTEEYSYSIVEGEELVQAYRDSSNYLSRNCMMHSDAIFLYRDNPSIVKCIIISRFNEVVGRVLVWKTDNDETFLDRVYPDDGGVHMTAVQDYALSQGYVVRLGTGFSPDGYTKKINEESLSKNGLDSYSDTVTLKDNGHYPYMDTWKYCIELKEKKKIVLSNKEHEHDVIGTLENIDDTYSGETRCDNCSETVSDLTFVQNSGSYCDDCLNDNYTYIDSANEYVPNDEVSCCDHNGCHSAILTEDGHSTANSEIVCDRCFNRYYSTCYTCDEAFETDDMQEVDDELYCNDHYNDAVEKKEEEERTEEERKKTAARLTWEREHDNLNDEAQDEIVWGRSPLIDKEDSCE